MRPLLLAAVLALPLAAPPRAATAEVPRVIADIPATGALAAQVMGDLGAPEVLLAPGSDEHSYQLRPSQARSLAAADLVIWIGPELTPWLDRETAAPKLSLLHAPGTRTRTYAGADEAEHGGAAHSAGAEAPEHGSAEHGSADHDHDSAEHGAAQHEAGHDHDAPHDHGGAHDHGGLDPHAWLDPRNARLWLGTIAERLAAQDPQNAATYRANAAAAAERLLALDAELAQSAAALHGKPFVTGHDAYGYLAARYDLDVIGTVYLGDASAAGADHPRDLLAKMGAAGALCIFPETQLDTRPVQRIAEGSGVRVGGPLDPSGSGHPMGPDLYAALLRDLMTTLVACLAP